MAVYKYKARDAAGKAVRGAMEAENKTALIDKLHSLGYMTTAVGEAGPEIAIGSLLVGSGRIGAEDMLMFYIQLANLIESGVIILTALNTLVRQTENKTLRETIDNVSRQLEAGSRLSAAFAMHPRIFNRLFVSMIKSGEETGKLDIVLKQYAAFFEQQEDLKRKVREAVFYPAILFSFGIAVTIFIVTFVIPQFAQIYLRAGIRLPLPTLIVYKIGLGMKYYWYAFAAFMIALTFALRRYFNTAGGEILLDRMKLRMRIIGPLYRKVCISRFASTLATLLGSGVPILASLEITKEVVGNRILLSVIENVRQAVERGERIAEPLKISEEFPQDVVQMVSVGEETGSLPQMLQKIAGFYDMNISHEVKKLTTIIEPLLLVVMGAMVGLIMASMLLPIFDMIKTLRH